MIVGNQVRLRGIEREDLPLYVNWLNDPEVIRNLIRYVPLSMGQEEQWYQNMLTLPTEQHALMIEVKKGEGWEPIGNTSFIDIDWRSRWGEIGIFIGEKSLWNHGYGCEAVRLMLYHGFDRMGLNRISLRVFETNPRAIHCYERAGFIHEGKMRQAHYLEGQFIDVLMMSVLRSEWKVKE